MLLFPYRFLLWFATLATKKASSDNDNAVLKGKEVSLVKLIASVQHINLIQVQRLVSYRFSPSKQYPRTWIRFTCWTLAISFTFLVNPHGRLLNKKNHQYFQNRIPHLWTFISLNVVCFIQWNRKRLFSLINDLPTLFEVVTGRKPTKDKPSLDPGSKSKNGVKVPNGLSPLFYSPSSKKAKGFINLPFVGLV